MMMMMMMMMFFIYVYIHKRLLDRNREQENNQSSNGIRIDHHRPPAKFHHITRFVNKHSRFTTGKDVKPLNIKPIFMYMYVSIHDKSSHTFDIRVISMYAYKVKEGAQMFLHTF